MATGGLGAVLAVRPPVDRFSAGGEAAGPSFDGVSEAVLSGLPSSLGELEAFEEEWLRWCFEPVCLAAAVTTSALGGRETVEQAKHVHAPLRKTSFTEMENILVSQR